MKYLTFLLLNFLLLPNFLMAETIPTKSRILKQSSECIKNSQNQLCIELISHIERLQLEVFDKKSFKCQSSLLGLQSELILAHFFKNYSSKGISFMIPHVIKNC